MTEFQVAGDGDRQLGERIKTVRNDVNQDRFAQEMGVSLSTLQRYEQGKTGVDAGFLKDICTKYPDVNPAWLLTGEGAMWAGKVQEPPAAAPPAIDSDLLAQIGEQIAEVYRQENGRIAPGPLARLSARIYKDLLEQFTPEERPSGLKGMMLALRRELRSPPIPGSANSKQAS